MGHDFTAGYNYWPAGVSDVYQYRFQYGSIEMNQLLLLPDAVCSHTKNLTFLGHVLLPENKVIALIIDAVVDYGIDLSYSSGLFSLSLTGKPLFY
jgi:hypothetical protein